MLGSQELWKTAGRVEGRRVWGCPVTVDTSLSGAHGGRNAGRACWIVAGSLCGGKLQGTFAQKLSNCWRCDFMNKVKKEEELETFGFTVTRLGLERVREKMDERRSG